MAKEKNPDVDRIRKALKGAGSLAKLAKALGKRSIETNGSKVFVPVISYRQLLNIRDGKQEGSNPSSRTVNAIKQYFGIR